MPIDDKISDEKLQYDINKISKMLVLSSRLIDSYEYCMGEEKLIYNRR